MHQLSESDLVAIERLEKTYVEGWFDEDPQTMVLSAFEENAIFIPHHGDLPVIGKNNLKEFFWPNNNGGFVHSFNHYRDTIEGSGNLAWIRGRFDIKYSWIEQKDTTTTINEGNYVMIVRKQENDQWKIATFIFNDPEAIIVN